MPHKVSLECESESRTIFRESLDDFQVCLTQGLVLNKPLKLTAPKLKSKTYCELIAHIDSPLMLKCCDWIEFFLYKR